MGVGFALSFVYVLCANWFFKKMDERHTEYVMLKMVLFLGGTAALLLGIYFLLLTPETRSVVLLRIDATTLTIGGSMAAIMGVYRLGWKRWPMFKHHSVTTYSYVFATLLLLSLASCVTYTFVSR